VSKVAERKTVRAAVRRNKAEVIEDLLSPVEKKLTGQTGVKASVADYIRLLYASHISHLLRGVVSATNTGLYGSWSTLLCLPISLIFCPGSPKKSPK
jgi:hypothetical protein